MNNGYRLYRRGAPRLYKVLMSRITESYCGSLVQVVRFVAIADNRYFF